MKSVLLNKLQTTGLIDSDSSSDLVLATTALKSGMKIEPTVYYLVYTVGNSEQLSVSTIGEAFADAIVDWVLAASHKVLIVPDQSILVDVLIGHSWLELPHMNYYKSGTKLIFEFLGQLDTKLLNQYELIDKADLLFVDREI